MRPRGILRTLLLWTAVWASSRAEAPRADDWRSLLPDQPVLTGSNALDRWRPDFPKLMPDDPRIADALLSESSPLAPDQTLPAELETWLAGVRPLLTSLRALPGEYFRQPPIYGPETPFPDHQPLRQLALVRNAAMHAAWRAGNSDAAISLALDNLDLARAVLTSQEGIIPAIQATGVWSVALDGVYWLVRRPDLTPRQASRLRETLLADDRLAILALERAFRGEFAHFTRVVVDRLPRTHDPELLLEGIGSLGLTPPSVPSLDETHLAIASRPPFDREATLQAAADEVRGWISAVVRADGHPREFNGSAELHRSWVARMPALVRYATTDAAVDRAGLAAADNEIADNKNALGKLFLVIASPRFSLVSVHVFRREAQRRALTMLLAWKQLGRPAPAAELVALRLLPAPPRDPFSDGPLRHDLAHPRVWSTGVDGLDDGGSGNGENIGRPADLAWPAGDGFPRAQ